MTSCSNDDESTEQTFFVNVYTKWEDSEEKVAKKAFLYIYENENKSIDNSQSTISVVNDGLITYTDGSKSSKPKYATKFHPVYSILKYAQWRIHIMGYIYGGIWGAHLFILQNDQRKPRL